LSFAARPAHPSVLRQRPESRRVSFAGDAVALVEAVRARQPAAIAAFYDLHAEHVHRLLARILGSDQDLRDVHHDVFVRALGSIDDLRDPACLKAWISSVAVLTARTCLQRRARRWWLRFMPPEDLAEVDTRSGVQDTEAGEALAATYRVLSILPADERIVFALRFVDGMELAELAGACGVSLATVKRRLARAEERFCAIARKHPVLCEWIQGGARWGSTT
jgi:RNA polymerase sigma-70 factor, ECF subfamily